MLDYPLDLMARVLDARVRGKGKGTVARVSTDSRTVQAGDLFFALSGERFDAHQFVADALKKGAVGAVVAGGKAPREAAAAGTLLEVKDPLLALGQLGAWHRNRYNPRVVAVTGSVGKTTTKDLIASVLSRQWTTLKSPGNLNAEIGLPLTLLEIRPEHEAVVVEMAMRGTGQIRYLARLARPEVAAITNIGLSHLEVLGSQDAIAAAKAELLDFLPGGGAAVLHGGDKYAGMLKARLRPDVRLLTFGVDERETISGKYLGGETMRMGDKGQVLGTRFVLATAGGRTVDRAWIPLLGKHNVLNALAAAAVGDALGISWPRIKRGLAAAEISSMRMAVHPLSDGATILDDAYNASSPEAMLGALQVLNDYPGIRKIAVLGNMLELGPASEKAHRQVGEALAGMKLHHLITVGDLAALIGRTAREGGLPADRIVECVSNDEALAELARRRRAGDVVLVKGSRGMAMEAVVRGLREGA